MQKMNLQKEGVLRAALLVLLINVVGMGKGYAQWYKVYSYDFSEVCPTGQTLWYKITDQTNHYVELVAPGFKYVKGNFSYWSGYQRPVGNLVVPEQVRGYTVVGFRSSNTVGTVYYDDGHHEEVYGGVGAFYSCAGLTSVTIPNTVSSLGSGTFYGCRGLTSMTIPNTVSSLGSSTFCGCSGLTSITIPNSVNTIGYGPFSDCSGLESITVEAGNTVYDSRDNSNAIIETGTNSLIAGCKNSVIPNSVTSIGAYAFSGCIRLTGSLNIPNSVIAIGQGAFANCSGLTGELIIPNSVTGIGSLAFHGCSGFTGSLTIPNSVTSIGYRTFGDCNGFNGNLTIGSSVTSIGQCAFCNCSGLTGTLIIPSAVTTIDKEAFSGCTGFTGLLTIPNSVTEIGDGAFNYCSGLSEIYFNTENCGGSIWLGCSGVTTIAIGDSVEVVRENMFTGFDNLTTLTIGKSVKTIGSMAFANNPRLNMIYYNVEKDLEAPTNVFSNCPNLTTIHIGADVQEIGSNIFKGCNTVHFVVALGPTPAILDAGAFSDIVDNSVLMVSCGKRVTYYSVWNMFPFNNIIEDCDTYGINVGAVGDGGTITPTVTEAQMGQQVQITITPNPGMVLVSIKVCNANDPTQIIPITPMGKSASNYSFVMPPFEVVVMATFKTSGTSVEENTVVSIPASVYPNPTTGFVKVEAENIRHISISNMLGQIIYDGKAIGNEFEYDFSEHGTGLYLIRIETSSGVVVKKVSVR